MELKQLDENVINRINTTVTSLQRVVVELVHNSMDAGSQNIVVTIDWNSLSLMIKDDGIGMSVNHLESLGKYKTSKIHQLSDLCNITTYGFKGQAIDAIRHVSRTYIISKTTNATNYKIDPTGTKCYPFDFDDIISNPKANNRFWLTPFNTSSNSGTILLVYDIFYNIPVRQHHTRRQGVNRFISDLKRQLVLLNRPINLQIWVDDELKIDVHEHDDLLTALFQIPSTQISRIKGHYGDYKITASLSQRFKRGYQFVILNNRIYHINLAYKKYPIFIITITNYPQIIGELFQDSNKTLWNSSHENNIGNILNKIFNRFYLEQIFPMSPIKRSKDQTTIGSGSLNESPSPGRSSTIPLPSESPTKPKSTTINRQDLQQIRVIGQVSLKFILVMIQNKLQIIDQHAMDERIQVEQLFHDLYHQRSMAATSIEIPQQYLGLFNEYQSYLDQFLTIELPHIIEIPQILSRIDQYKLIQALLDYINDVRDYKKFKLTNDWFTSINNWPQIIVNAINSKACRGAIMFGDELDLATMNDMVNKLGRCRLPFQCAHGRPLIVPLIDIL